MDLIHSGGDKGPPSRPKKEKILAEELCFSADLKWVAQRTLALELTGRYNASPQDPTLRLIILKQLFGTVGESCFIEPSFLCDYDGNNLKKDTNLVMTRHGYLTPGNGCFFILF